VRGRRRRRQLGGGVGGRRRRAAGGGRRAAGGGRRAAGGGRHAIDCSCPHRRPRGPAGPAATWLEKLLRVADGKQSCQRCCTIQITTGSSFDCALLQCLISPSLFPRTAIPFKSMTCDRTAARAALAPTMRDRRRLWPCGRIWEASARVRQRRA
jgi:hypothetical protein